MADTYTMQTPQLSRADRELSPRLAAAVDREHRFVRADLAPAKVHERLSQIAEHTDGEAFDMPPLATITARTPIEASPRASACPNA